MACRDCFNNCDPVISDNCVKYEGPDIELLDICKGDSLSKVEAAIIEHLLSAIDGTGILPEDVTLENCEWLKQELNAKSPTLVNLLQLLIDASCTLKELVDDLASDSYTFNTKCLADLPDDATRDDIVQAAITQLCSLKTTVDAIPTTYVKVSDLETLVNTIIKEYNTTNASISIPKNCPIPYIGTLSNFDNTGKGIVGEYIGWYIMNGKNNTQDWRGYKVVGAVKDVPGNTLDDRVNPLIQGASTNYAVGEKFGSPFHTLTISEMPAHSHGITDPGHTHNYDGYVSEGRPCGSKCDREDVKSTKATTPQTTNITINSTGGGQKHENRDPTVAAVWIVKL